MSRDEATAAIERLGGKVCERCQPKNDISGCRRRRGQQARESDHALGVKTLTEEAFRAIIEESRP